MLKNLHKYRLTSSTDIRGNRTRQVIADISMSPQSMGGASNGVTGMGISSNFQFGILEGIVQSTDDRALRQYYRDIYLHDSIAGAAVDIMSALPFDQFTLTQLPDAQMAQTFMHAIDRLKLNSLMPKIAVDYRVMGQYIGILNFDLSTKSYSSLVSQQPEKCEIIPVPIHGEDPTVRVQFTAAEAQSLRDRKDLLDRLPKGIREAILGGRKLTIEPQNLLYIPRSMGSTDAIGTSYYRRILPFYFYEKALLRGTIALAHRRQRSILHVQAGEEDWIPTPSELQTLVQLFNAADMDPISATIATRNNIQVNEVRPGSDFWKFDEIYDVISTAKMRALGISEALLSGDVTLSTMEAALSLFTDQLRAFRQELTRKVFYEKLLPQIAILNEFKKSNVVTGSNIKRAPVIGKYITTMSENGRVSIRGNQAYQPVHASSVGVDVNLEEYYIPTVNWNKPLKPEADRDYMEILQTLSEAGVPIPIRLMAASAGFNIDDINQSLDEDLETRKKLADYRKKIDAINEGGGGGGGDDDSGDDLDISSDEGQVQASAANKILRRFKNREELMRDKIDSRGKRRYVSMGEARRIDEKANRKICEAIKNLGVR